MRLRKFCLMLTAGLAVFTLAIPAHAELLINVDKALQLMTVTEDGEQIHVWPVSTGMAGYDTPNGEWKPFRMEKDHFSREWDDAPMPNSIFFTQEGHAIHGTFDAKNLGKPASHGCVRLSRANSATLWSLLRKHKMANTKVVLTGEIPGGAGTPVAKRQPRDRDEERFYSTDIDGDYTAAAARRQRAARSSRDYYYDNAPRYYFREPPPVARRYYRQAPPFPFGW